ncbi:triacylglycerol lipase OBL1-like [Bidens hawaiensis]|uniref:triacylglycerol lipase OBL1-like n=1 Tax=Bidens hawaiensis TaxID=980011 RepID=UPI004049184E
MLKTGKVHAGFLKALGLQKSQELPKDIKSDNQNPYAYYLIRQKLKERLENNPNAKFFLTGHSLGAALSVVFPAILAYHNETDLLSKLEGVYTFGQPRVGDHQFGEHMKGVLASHGSRYLRFVYCNDLVPRVPFDSSDVYFKHFGDCHYYNSFCKGQVLPEEPNKNYFSILSIIPIGWRVTGLLIAGLSAHGPPDYVNITRLGSPDLFMNSSADRSTNDIAGYHYTLASFPRGCPRSFQMVNVGKKTYGNPLFEIANYTCATLVEQWMMSIAKWKIKPEVNKSNTDVQIN